MATKPQRDEPAPYTADDIARRFLTLPPHHRAAPKPKRKKSAKKRAK